MNLFRRCVYASLFLVMFLAGCELYIGAPSYGVSRYDCADIYSQLRVYTGMPNDIPPLNIIDSPIVNAWVSNDGLTVTTGMLNFVDNKDELAGIIGHEMGHYAMGHLREELKDDSRIHEANADKFGAYLTLRAGYNPCKIGNFWKKFNNLYGEDAVTTTHPGNSQRMWWLDFPLCHSIWGNL